MCKSNTCLKASQLEFIDVGFLKLNNNQPINLFEPNNAMHNCQNEVMGLECCRSFTTHYQKLCFELESRALAT
jgi:hypothetical protein